MTRLKKALPDEVSDNAEMSGVWDSVYLTLPDLEV